MHALIDFAAPGADGVGAAHLEEAIDAGLEVVGVGRNIAEAREPVVVERNGRRIAFIACSSILPMSYWAEANRPGCVPMRAFTHYEAIERDQPGTKPRVHTYAHRDDLAALLADAHAEARGKCAGDRKSVV